MQMNRRGSFRPACNRSCVELCRITWLPITRPSLISHYLVKPRSFAPLWKMFRRVFEILAVCYWTWQLFLPFYFFSLLPLLPHRLLSLTCTSVFTATGRAETDATAFSTDFSKVMSSGKISRASVFSLCRAGVFSLSFFLSRDGSLFWSVNFWMPSETSANSKALRRKCIWTWNFMCICCMHLNMDA